MRVAGLLRASSALKLPAAQPKSQLLGGLLAAVIVATGPPDASLAALPSEAIEPAPPAVEAPSLKKPLTADELIASTNEAVRLAKEAYDAPETQAALRSAVDAANKAASEAASQAALLTTDGAERARLKELAEAKAKLLPAEAAEAAAKAASSALDAGTQELLKIDGVAAAAAQVEQAQRELEASTNAVLADPNVKFAADVTGGTLRATKEVIEAPATQFALAKQGELLF